MAGPQDFMPSVPSLRVDTAPLLKIADLLSNAPLNAAKGFEAGTDIALKRALANPADYTDSSGNIDWGKLVKLGAQKGGLPFVEKLAPYVYMSGSNLPQTTSQTRQLLTGEQPEGTAAAAAGPASDPQNADYFGHFVGGIKHAESGAEKQPYSTVISTGTGHKVYGAYQVEDINIPQWTQEVLNKRMTPQQFLADPKAQDAVAHAKLGEYVQKYGYAGAARAWLAGEAGMNNPRAGDRFGSTPTGYAAKVLSHASATYGAARSGASTAAATAPGQPTPAPVAASASDQAGSRAAIMGQAPDTARRMPVSTGAPSVPQTVGRGGATVPTTGVVPAPPPAGGLPAGPQATAPRQPQPVPTGPGPEPGTAGPAAPQQPPPQAVAQPAARQPLPPLPDPALTDPTILANKRQIGLLRQQAVEEGKIPQVLGRKSGAEALEAQAKGLEEENAKRAERLNEPLKKINEARIEGFPDVQTRDAFVEAQKKASEAGSRQLEAINTGAQQMVMEVEPHISTGKGLLNSGTIYTGFGAEKLMELNQAKQMWGNNFAATPQEAFKKTIAAAQLGMANLQRVMAGIGGSQGGASRLFAAQINLIGEGSASLGNTVAGNRFLMENGERSIKQFYAIQKLASDYIAAGHPTLDQNFDQKIVDYVREHPLLTEQERSNPAKFLSAPQVPKAVAEAAKNDPSALPKWQRMVGAKEGDPIRKSNGSGYFSALKLTVPVGKDKYGPNP